MPKTLAQWLRFIEQNHPSEIDMGLSRTQQVLDRLCLDMSNTRVVTVAGTNGKGTTCTTIESVLQSSGLTVGRYASPHMLRFNERIVVNGEEADDADICYAFEQVCNAQKAIPLTYFEYATLAALVCFVSAKVDVIVLEVGLGGRLDATNVLDANVAVITSIGFDHQDWLGDTLQQIAREKAGIIKPKSRVVLGFKAEEVGLSLPLQAEANGDNSIWQAGVDFKLFEAGDAAMHDDAKFDKSRGLINPQLVPTATELDAPIEYVWQNQQVPNQNVMTAIAALWQLTYVLEKQKRERLLHCLLDKTRIETSIQKVRLLGRVQTLSTSPLVLADVAHNQQAAEYLASQLQCLPQGIENLNEHLAENLTFHFVVGMLKDKNIDTTLQAMSAIKARWYPCTLGSLRGESAERLIQYLKSNGQDIVGPFDSVEAGLDKALECAISTDIICVFGSFLTVAEAIPRFVDREVL
ncbi:bifunctional folylpolyglutamate synthase/dihydrofolate synthase [Agaribacter flavus]|uniref:Dihydrofolate synthase/folylpolyglutamate synthase n=1 Tax=Agaribacter flavus TaxID=1902781 RepID=A0ABV7FJ74_9ALTE